MSESGAKKRGPKKDENLLAAHLRVGIGWLKAVDEVIPESERSAFMRAVVREYLADPRPVAISEAKERPLVEKIEWLGHRPDLERVRGMYGYMSAEVIRLIVLEAALKMRKNLSE